VFTEEPIGTSSSGSRRFTIEKNKNGGIKKELILVVLVFAFLVQKDVVVSLVLSVVSFKQCVGRESQSLKSCFPTNPPNRSHLYKNPMECQRKAITHKFGY